MPVRAPVDDLMFGYHLTEAQALLVDVAYDRTRMDEASVHAMLAMAVAIERLRAGMAAWRDGTAPR